MSQFIVYVLGIVIFCLSQQVLAGNLNVTEDTKLNVLAYGMCPYTSFCISGNSSAPEGYYSCCEECSCSDDCHLANQCCPDAEIRNTNTDLTCKYQFEYFDVHRNIFIEEKYPTYLIVNTCDATENEEDLVNGCLQPSSLEDHILVSDKSTSMIYKNGKCAQCNGIETYETWNLFGMCPFDAALLNLEQRSDFALAHCSFVSMPPKNTENLYEPMRCSPEVIGVCNYTREWDFYDEDLDRACSTYNMKYIEENLSGDIVKSYRIFKNVYCYLCNNKRGTIPSDVCIQDIDTERDMPVTFAPFSAIFGLFKPETVEMDGGQCHIDEIEDPFTGACTHLYCPFGHVPVHGSCVVIMHEPVVSLSAVYKLDITASQTDPQNQDFSSIVFQTLVNHVQTKFTQNGCDICNLKLFSDDTFTIFARPSKYCPMSTLLKVFEYLAAKKVTQPMGNKIAVHMKQTNNYTMLQNTRFLKVHGLVELHEFKKRWCHLGVHLTTKFSCARIAFDVKDVDERGINRTTREKLLALSDPFEFENNTITKYVICLSDYKKLKNAAGNHVSVWIVYFVLIIMTLC